MPDDIYKTVLERLSYLKVFAPKANSFSPLVSRSMITCLVDDRLTVHALRCGGNAAESPMAAPRPIEYLQIASSDQVPGEWRKLGELFYTSHPDLWWCSGKLAAGVIGCAEESADAQKLLSFQFYTFPVARSGAPVSATRVLDRVQSAVRVACNNGGKTYAVTRKWFPPPVEPSSFALWCAAFHDGKTETIADPLEGTDVAGSYPQDIAVYAGGDDVHVVYDGRRHAAEPKEPRLWHLVLDTNSKRLMAKDLGKAPSNIILMVLVSGPDKRLVLLVVYVKDHLSGEFGHQLIPIDGFKAAFAGPIESFFVDYWLQPHLVKFDRSSFNYNGPDGIPSHTNSP